MYQVTIRGRTIDELKNAINDVHQELLGGVIAKAEVQKDLSESEKAMPENMANALDTVKQVNEKTQEATPSEGDVDSFGTPYDKRIHSSSKKQTQEGRWKKRKGVDDETFKSVMNEITGQAQQAPATPAAPVAEAASTPAAPTQPQQSVPSPAPQPQMNNGGHTLDSFKQNFPMILGNLISEGKINQEYVNQLKQHFGVEEIWAINDNQKEDMFNSFVEFGFIQKVG